MKEKFELPHADKVVGLPSEYAEHQEDLERNFAKYFEAGGLAEEFEIEKTPKDMEIIGFAEGAVKEYLQQYGRKKDLEIPTKNIHLYEDGGVEKLTKGKLMEGAHSALSNAIAIDRKKSDVDFALRIFHELVHAKSYKALQITKERKPEAYRTGFSITSRDGEIIYFRSIEEALAGFLTERFYKEHIIGSEMFREEVARLEKEEREPDFGREEERKTLNELIESIWSLNKEKFKDKREIADLFLEAQVTGKLLKVARLIEGTFGKGSFRKLGENTASN